MYGREQVTCSECGKTVYPHRELIYDKRPETCGADDCQRARKTRLQRERRMKQRRSTLPHRGKAA